MTRPDRAALGSRPDWVMVGMPGPAGGVWLIASKDMNQAELRAEFDRAMLDDGWDVIPGPVTRHEYTLTASMRRFTLIEAADYPAAFRSLFDRWTPEPAPAAELPGRLTLPPGGQGPAG